MTKDASIHPGLRGLLAVLMVALSVAILAALTSAVGQTSASVPTAEVGLWGLVEARLEESGANHAVTAVLLNFRAYDTLLEIAVLMIALVSIWSLGDAPGRARFVPAGRVLRRVVSVLVPLMVLVAGYLVWAGASYPGGAFPAGAVAAAALVLVLLANMDVLGTHAWLLRVGIVLGLLTFVSVGLVGIASGGRFLEYPGGWAGALIVLVEIAGAISITLILAGVFAGSASRLMRLESDAEPP